MEILISGFIIIIQCFLLLDNPITWKRSNGKPLRGLARQRVLKRRFWIETIFFVSCTFFMSIPLVQVLILLLTIARAIIFYNAMNFRGYYLIVIENKKEIAIFCFDEEEVHEVVLEYRKHKLVYATKNMSSQLAIEYSKHLNWKS